MIWNSKDNSFQTKKGSEPTIIKIINMTGQQHPQWVNKALLAYSGHK